MPPALGKEGITLRGQYRPVFATNADLLAELGMDCPSMLKKILQTKERSSRAGNSDDSSTSTWQYKRMYPSKASLQLMHIRFLGLFWRHWLRYFLASTCQKPHGAQRGGPILRRTDCASACSGSASSPGSSVFSVSGSCVFSGSASSNLGKYFGLHSVEAYGSKGTSVAPIWPRNSSCRRSPLKTQWPQKAEGTAWQNQEEHHVSLSCQIAALFGRAVMAGMKLGFQ